MSHESGWQWGAEVVSACTALSFKDNFNSVTKNMGAPNGAPF